MTPEAEEIRCELETKFLDGSTTGGDDPIICDQD